MEPYYESKLGRLFLGDCLDVLPELETVDLVLTDPPYGISADKGVFGYGASPQTAKKYNDTWDKRPSREVFNIILLASRAVIFFGGNYFADILPRSTHWIVWDKVGVMNFKNPFSDCELAWTNLGKKTVKKYFVLQQGFVTSEKARYHPTQKPVALFSLIIDDYLLEGGTVCDPFAGSGSTGIACERLNRKYILIEKEEKYAEIAAKRIESEASQFKLFG